MRQWGKSPLFYYLVAPRQTFVPQVCRPEFRPLGQSEELDTQLWYQCYYSSPFFLLLFLCFPSSNFRTSSLMTKFSVSEITLIVDPQIQQGESFGFIGTYPLWLALFYFIDSPLSSTSKNRPRPLPALLGLPRTSVNLAKFSYLEFSQSWDSIFSPFPCCSLFLAKLSYFEFVAQSFILLCILEELDTQLQQGKREGFKTLTSS